MSTELLEKIVDLATKHPKVFAELLAASRNGQGGSNGAPPPAVAALDVLTLTEAAAYLRLSESDVRMEAESGRLKGRAVGGDWRFVREDVLKWIRTPRPVSALKPELEETEEEFEAFLATIRAQADEVDRATKSGKYAEDE